MRLHPLGPCMQKVGMRPQNLLVQLQEYLVHVHFASLRMHRQAVQEVRVGMNHGLGLGEWDLDAEIIHIRTFVSFGQLFPGQQDLMERLDAQRAWDSLTRGQQTERLARVKRLEEEHAKEAFASGRAA